jgi:hypothetical protein
LASLFPTELIGDIVRERDVVQRDRKIDITMLVWTLIMGFAIETTTATTIGSLPLQQLLLNCGF